MAKYTAVASQAVAGGANVAFVNDVIPCNRGYLIHRADSGVITMRGLTNQCFARYAVRFQGNVAIPAGGTVGPVTVALTVNGEVVGSAVASVVPAAVGDLWHVSLADYIDVPRGCCVNVSVRNTGADAIDVQNANLIITREA